MNIIKQKLNQSPILKKLNKFRLMPIIWWGIVIAVLPYISSLLKIGIVWRIGIVFLIVNGLISYHVGKLIKSQRISKLWIIYLPIIFCLAILPKFASYNLVLGLVYLIFELFGLMDNNFYR